MKRIRTLSRRACEVLMQDDEPRRRHPHSQSAGAQVDADRVGGVCTFSLLRAMFSFESHVECDNQKHVHTLSRKERETLTQEVKSRCRKR
jgi:hypothetical protein